MKWQKRPVNFLEFVPVLKKGVRYTVSDRGRLTLEISNKGLLLRLCQRFFKSSPVSYIHLDDMGSFSLLCADGEKNIIEIGNFVTKEFGQKAEPLYERLARYFLILKSYGLIELTQNHKDVL